MSFRFLMRQQRRRDDRLTDPLVVRECGETEHHGRRRCVDVSQIQKGTVWGNEKDAVQELGVLSGCRSCRLDPFEGGGDIRHEKEREREVGVHWDDHEDTS